MAEVRIHVVQTHNAISSKSMDELDAILSEDDIGQHHHHHQTMQNNHRNRKAGDRNRDQESDDDHGGEGQEQEHVPPSQPQTQPPPAIERCETTDSTVVHIGDLVLHSVQSYPEVLYEKSTPLFTAIEHTKWREAYQLAKEFPQQITTWVVSQNKEQTDLGWSLWRRLPLHEACRRQAPAWLVAQLVSAFPESVQCTTQFGEYPLHLAVECGATPEVVHVLVVAYWPAVVARDNGGRTPLEILEESELLVSSPSGESDDVNNNNSNNSPTGAGSRFAEISEVKIIYQSLMRSQQTYLQIQQDHEQQKSDMELKHDVEVAELKHVHDHQVQQERVRHKTLEDTIERMHQQYVNLQHEMAKKDSKLLAMQNLESIYQDRVEEQKSTVEALRLQLQHKDVVIDKLTQALQDKEEQVLREQDRAAGLSHDVWHMTRLHDTQLQDVLQQAETALQNLIHCQLAVHGQWLGQHRALHHILQQRGIPEPTPSAATTSSEMAAVASGLSNKLAAAAAAAAIKDEEREVMEEKKNEEEAMDGHMAAQAAAAAARQALQTADQKRDADVVVEATETREPPSDTAALEVTDAAVEAVGAAAVEAAAAAAETTQENRQVVLSDDDDDDDTKKLKPIALLPAERVAGKEGVVSSPDDAAAAAPAADSAKKGLKGGAQVEVDDFLDDDEDSDDDEEEEEGDEEFDSDDDDDDDDEEYDSQDETDDDSGSEIDTSDDEDEEFSIDEGLVSPVKEIDPTELLTATIAKAGWKKQ